MKCIGCKTTNDTYYCQTDGNYPIFCTNCALKENPNDTELCVAVEMLIDLDRKHKETISRLEMEIASIKNEAILKNLNIK